MSNFGKLDFAVSLNPTSAFPVDARTVFESVELAAAAAATAEEIGSTNTKYYYGMRLLVIDGSTPRWFRIQRDKTLLEEVVPVYLTQEEYDALVAAGEVNSTTPYMIVRDDA